MNISNALPLLDGDAPRSASQKRAATLLRQKDERRADSLDQIRAQIADGTLVVRHMTVVEHKAASQTARGTLARNEARREHAKALYNRDP
jgi:GTP cyclohydrolase III